MIYGKHRKKVPINASYPNELDHISEFEDNFGSPWEM